LRIWSFALLQFALASGALAWGAGLGWTPVVYRVFYLFGAVLNVAWLALGTVWLVSDGSAPRSATGAIIGLSLWASFNVVTAPLLPGAEEALAVARMPEAVEVLPIEPRIMARIVSTIGSVILLWGLVAGIRRRRQATLGLVLIALGVVVNALAGTLARAGQVEVFSIGLVVGVTLMFAGFMQTRRR
jgi:hypothetical protein